MPDSDMAILSKRMEALEKAIIHLKGPQGDPPPDDLGHWRWDIVRRLQDLERFFQRHFPRTGDPPPDDLGRLGSDLVRTRLGDLLRVNPGWFTDPPPDDFLNVRVLDLIRRFRGGFTDPAPDDLGNIRLRDLLQRIPGGGVTDPSPEDLNRMTLSEVETQLHKIGAELVRLKSIERVMQERVQQLKGAKKQ